MPEFNIPDWLVGALPVINFLVNELIVRLGGDLSSDGKKNLVTSVSIAIAAGLAVFGGVTIPDGPSTSLLMDWAPYVLGIGLYVWGGAKGIHDLLEAIGVKDAAKQPALRFGTG